MKVWLLNTSEQLAYSGSPRRRMRTGLLAKALIDRGHQVTWWKSTFEHVSKAHYRTTDGFEDVEPNLRIGWIHSRGYRRHVSLARALDHIEAGARFGRLARRQEAPNMLVCSFPPPELALAGVAFARRHKVPAVIDVRDWWPDALIYSLPKPMRGVAAAALGPYRSVVQRACRGATAITGITSPFLDWGLAQARRPPGPLDRVFPHGYERPIVQEADRMRARAYWDALAVPTRSQGCTVVFVGSVSRVFDFDPLLESARTFLRSPRPVTFVICGSGDRLPRLRARAKVLENVVLTERWLDTAELQELLQRASLGLVPLPERPDFLATISNKVIEYLSAGVPIIASPDNSHVARLVRDEKLGMVWDGIQTERLSSIIAGLADDPFRLESMSLRGLDCFERHYVATDVFSRFAEYLEDVSSGAAQLRGPAALDAAGSGSNAGAQD